MKKLFVALSVFALLTSCKNTPKQAEGPTKMEQVMGIHDEIMPKMGTIARLVGTLNDEIELHGSTPEKEKAVKDLQNAHKFMMDWMKEFGGHFSADEILKGAPLTSEKQETLLEQEVKVNQLKSDILGSIERAEALLK